MEKNYPDYDDLREQYEEGNISAVEITMTSVSSMRRATFPQWTS